MKVEVRRASVLDIPAIIAMAEDMHAESPRYRELSFDAEKINALALALVRGNGAGGVLVAQDAGRVVGMLAFHVAEHFFGHDTFASDVVMYVRPEYRGTFTFPRLVAAFEKWADEYGVTEKLLGVSAEIDSPRVVAVLERMGYKTVATGTMKRK